jgi:hypothetical protein
VVGVHLDEAADTFTLALGGVVNVAAAFQTARVATDKGQTAHEGVGGDLEGQGREGLSVVSVADDGLAVLSTHTLDSRDVERAGHVVHNGVEHGLNALVLVRGAADHRGDLALDGQLAQTPLDLLDRQFLAVEVLLHQRVVGFGSSFDDLSAVHLGRLDQILRDRHFPHVLAEVIAVDDGHVADQVDDALEGILGADRQLDGNRAGVEALLHHADHTIEVGAQGVHLVDVGHARNAVTVSLAPHGFGLRLNATLGAEHSDGPVENPERTFDFNGEVHVSGRVDDVNTVTLPPAGGSSGGDRDAPLLLLHHPVHRGSALVHLAKLVSLAGVEENTLGGRGLAGVDVRHNPDVAQHIQRYLSRHRTPPFD